MKTKCVLVLFTTGDRQLDEVNFEVENPADASTTAEQLFKEHQEDNARVLDYSWRFAK